MNVHADIRIDVDQIIDRGMKYLSGSQTSSSEFNSYLSRDPSMHTDCVFDSSPFPTALIMYCLSFSGSPVARKMIDQASRFLLAEMESHGVWRYWTAQHKYHKNIPPDLDDIACISAVLQQHGHSFPDNKNILLANRNEDGLFYTWIVPRIKLHTNIGYLQVVLKEAIKPVRLYYFWKHNESEPNDIDAVVNANVLFYLGSRPETKPVINYLIGIIKNNKEEGSDKWHLSPFNLQYFLSKNYRAGITQFDVIRNESIDKLLNIRISPVKEENNILEIALAGCALLNWNCPPAMFYPYIHEILQQQDHTGAWPIFPLYYGGPKKYYGWGSQEITTAYCLEALIRYQQAVALSAS